MNDVQALLSAVSGRAVAVLALAILVSVLGLRSVLATSNAATARATGQPVLVLRRSVAAGAVIDPANVLLVRAASPRPVGALTGVELVAFRPAAVAIPAGLVLVPSLVGHVRPVEVLGAGERVVGVRVDEVSGLPAILEAGAIVEVVLGGGAWPVERIDRAVVLARPSRMLDSGAWAVSLRLPTAAARRVSIAQTAGRDVRLLLRSAAP